MHATAAVAGEASPVPDLVVVADAAGHVHHRTMRTDIMGSSDNIAADAARLVDAAVTAADAAASALPTRFDPFKLPSVIPPWCSKTILLTPVPAPARPLSPCSADGSSRRSIGCGSRKGFPAAMRAHRFKSSGLLEWPSCTLLCLVVSC